MDDDSLSTLICNLMVDLIEDAEGRSMISVGRIVDEFCKWEHIALVIYRGLSSTAQFLLHQAITSMEKDSLPLLHLHLYTNKANETNIINKGNNANNSNQTNTENKTNKDFELALEQLKTLHLVLAYDSESYLVNEQFCNNLIGYLMGIENVDQISNAEKLTNKNALNKLDKERDVLFLRNYAQNRWNSVLNFITQNCVQEVNGIKQEAKFTTTQDIFQILSYANVIETVCDESTDTIKNDEGFEVTSIGFNFLLMPIEDQIRFYIANYLRYIYYNIVDDVEPNIEQLIGLVSFLCMIERHNEAEPFHLVHTYPNMYSEYIRHFREIGLIYRKNSSTPYITFTNYAIKSLSNRHIEQDSLHNKKSVMVLETNLRLYLYNPTELRIALIALFAEILVQFPNLCIARITRESMQHAFNLGITSKQIITFILNDMKKVASYKMQLQLPSDITIEKLNNENDSSHKKHDYDGILPPTVVDQILIWEKERHRLKHSFGILLDQFNDEIAYENAIKDIVAVDPSQLLYNNAKNRTLVLSTENEKLVDKFSKQF